MLGFIGFVIANQSALQRKITMQEKRLCWPPTFFLDRAVPPQFFHTRIATVDKVPNTLQKDMGPSIKI